MIRPLRQEDLDRAVEIWLAASLQAHDFIAGTFWESKAIEMRRLYFPNSETYVFENENGVEGFISLTDDTVAALFVDPPNQGHGIGTALLDHAKSLREGLDLTVYAENGPSVAFYIAQGFEISGEGEDPATGHPELTMKYRSR